MQLGQLHSKKNFAEAVEWFTKALAETPKDRKSRPARTISLLAR